MQPVFSTTPPARHNSLPSLRVAEMRKKVGALPPSEWQRAVRMRDPVTLLKRTHPHVNRATFKMHELVARLFRDARAPSNAVFLAEAPGGFLYCARRVWPRCECTAMSSLAPGAIGFIDEADPSLLHDLPHHSDLLHPEVIDAIVDRCGAASIEFVSADGGIEVPDLDAAEQHSTLLVLAQAAAALEVQACGGSLVLKIFEGCTLVTRELFEILRALYTKIMLFKPLSSKASNSERYVVGVGLRSPQAARSTARGLRAAIERCRGAAPPLFVVSLGVHVPAATHDAFDQMAAEQAAAIDALHGRVQSGQLADLRATAATDAKRVEALFGEYEKCI